MQSIYSCVPVVVYCTLQLKYIVQIQHKVKTLSCLFTSCGQSLHDLLRPRESTIKAECLVLLCDHTVKETGKYQFGYFSKLSTKISCFIKYIFQSWVCVRACVFTHYNTYMTPYNLHLSSVLRQVSTRVMKALMFFGFVENLSQQTSGPGPMSSVDKCIC